MSAWVLGKTTMALSHKNLGVLIFAVVFCARPAAAVLVFDLTPLDAWQTSPSIKWDCGAFHDTSVPPLESPCPWRRACLPVPVWLDGGGCADFSGTASSTCTITTLFGLGPVAWRGLVFLSPSPHLRVQEEDLVPGFFTSRIFRPPRLRRLFRG